MGSDRIEELLLQLIQDMAELKAKINAMDEQKLSSRIDMLEAQGREQERVIKSLEKRADTMEEFTRNSLNEQNKTEKLTEEKINNIIGYLDSKFYVNSIFNRDDIIKAIKKGEGDIEKVCEFLFV